MNDLIWTQKVKPNDTTPNPLQRLHEAMVFTSDDLSLKKRDAFMYAIIVGWDDAAYNELKITHNWSDKDVRQMKDWHHAYKKAWNLFMINKEGLDRINDLNPNTEPLTVDDVAPGWWFKLECKGYDFEKQLAIVNRAAKRYFGQ